MNFEDPDRGQEDWEDDDLLALLKTAKSPLPKVSSDILPRLQIRVKRQKRQSTIVRGCALFGILGLAFIESSNSLLQMENNKFAAEKIVVDSFSSPTEGIEADDGLYYP